MGTMPDVTRGGEEVGFSKKKVHMPSQQMHCRRILDLTQDISEQKLTTEILAIISSNFNQRITFKIPIVRGSAPRKQTFLLEIFIFQLGYFQRERLNVS